MRWKEKPYQKPVPERWFAWYPVTLTAYGVTCWWEWVWRIEVTINSELHFFYSDSEEGCLPDNIAKRIAEGFLPTPPTASGEREKEG